MGVRDPQPQGRGGAEDLWLAWWPCGTGGVAGVLGVRAAVVRGAQRWGGGPRSQVAHGEEPEDDDDEARERAGRKGWGGRTLCHRPELDGVRGGTVWDDGESQTWP